MAMTKEERRAHLKQLQEKRQEKLMERERNFPSCFYESAHIILTCRSGESGLNVIIRSDRENNRDQYRLFPEDNLLNFVVLIRALVARYNHAVKHANETAAEIRMQMLSTIDLGATRGDTNA